jgi:GT2 family glycosyltransferase
MPRVLAIVCNWNKKEMLRSLLTTLRSLGGARFDVLVVDNASSDGSPEMVRSEFPEFALLETGANLGGTGGFNAGMAAGLDAEPGYDFLWLLDNDVVVHEGALDALLAAASSDAKIALVGSAILLLGDPTRVQEMGAIVDWDTGDLRRAGEGPLAELPKGTLFEVDYCAACSLLARVEAVREVGTWDPAYFVFWDDIDWGLRMKAAGWRVVSAVDSLVRHESFDNRRPTSGGAMNYLRFRNGYYFFWRFCPTGKKFALLYKQFRANLGYADSYEFDGDPATAMAMRRAVADPIAGRMGTPDWEAFKAGARASSSAGDGGAKPSGIKRIALMARDNPALMLKLVAKLQSEFPGATIETLLFAKNKEIAGADLPAKRNCSMDSLGARFRLAATLPFRYDAIVAPDYLPRFFFDRLVRWNIRANAAGELKFSRRSMGKLLALLVSRLKITIQAFTYTMRYVCTAPPPVSYYRGKGRP